MPFSMVWQWASARLGRHNRLSVARRNYNRQVAMGPIDILYSACVVWP